MKYVKDVSVATAARGRESAESALKDAMLRHTIAAPGDPGYVKIAHVDAGIAPHAGLNWTRGLPAPEGLDLAGGRNFYDPDAGHDVDYGGGAVTGALPITPMTYTENPLAELIEYPDHGVKTLSVMLSSAPNRLRGVAPYLRVRPYRVANGPLFASLSRDEEDRLEAVAAQAAKVPEAMAQAIRHAIEGDPPACRVISLSMGNPGYIPLLMGLGGMFGHVPSGAGAELARAVDAAYEKGVIVVCAAGQIVDSVVYPARFARTIAVGGFDTKGSLFIHYPPAGYKDPGPVDIWARAERINRAALTGAGEEAEEIWADPKDNPPHLQGIALEKPSGTSYATPQVAAAAALWLTLHGEALEAKFGKRSRRWMIVECFREALARGVGKHGWQNAAIGATALDATPEDETGADVTARIAPLDIGATLAADLKLTKLKKRDPSPTGWQS